MFARLAKILVVVMLVVSTGLHWAALQTVAWTTMLANNLAHAMRDRSGGANLRRQTPLSAVQGHRRRQKIRKEVRGRFTGVENGIPAGGGTAGV